MRKSDTQLVVYAHGRQNRHHILSVRSFWTLHGNVVLLILTSHILKVVTLFERPTSRVHFSCGTIASRAALCSMRSTHTLHCAQIFSNNTTRNLSNISAFIYPYVLRRDPRASSNIPPLRLSRITTVLISRFLIRLQIAYHRTVRVDSDHELYISNSHPGGEHSFAARVIGSIGVISIRSEHDDELQEDDTTQHAEGAVVTGERAVIVYAPQELTAAVAKKRPEE